MPRFLPLTVTEVRKTIRDAVVLTLSPVDSAAFAFRQGQYLTFKQDFDGTEVRRNYSICTSPDEGKLQVGIKRVDGGAFSTFANDTLAVGDTLYAMSPMGRFYCEIEPEKGKTYLFFAAGSGITPVLSNLKAILKTEPKSDVTLVYANRAVNTIMFREDLEDLKNRHMGRLTIIHILGSGQDIDLFSGRLDADKCAELFKHWIDVPSVDLAFICGPEPMMMTLVDSLKSHGLAEDRIKFELFGASQIGRLGRRPDTTTTGNQAGTAAKVTVEGATRAFTMRRDQSVLEAAIENNLDAPFACRAGVCSTCKARVTEGEYEMRVNHALEDYEVEQGMVLTCQCYPLSDRISVEYDTH
jgi:ring-1,2-phenylacetyl-CoA epoxidase subunit PaaE